MRQKETGRALLTHWQGGIFDEYAMRASETVASYNHTSHTNRHSSVIKSNDDDVKKKGIEKTRKHKSHLCSVCDAQMQNNEHAAEHTRAHK